MKNFKRSIAGLIVLAVAMFLAYSFYFGLEHANESAFGSAVVPSTHFPMMIVFTLECGFGVFFGLIGIVLLIGWAFDEMSKTLKEIRKKRLTKWLDKHPIV